MLSIKDLVNKPFGVSAARWLCRLSGIFETGKVYARDEICEELLARFVTNGGSSGTIKADVATVLKGWLPKRDSPFEKEDRGQYRFIGFDGQDAAFEYHTEGSASSNDDSLTPDREFGEGRFEVYAWALPLYQKVPGERWPIKIGKTGTDGFRRRLRDFQENLPERPQYLLRIGCKDEAEARRREGLLHAWFTERKRKIDDLPGEEWFRTNPGEIEEAIQTIMLVPKKEEH